MKRENREGRRDFIEIKREIGLPTGQK